MYQYQISQHSKIKPIKCKGKEQRENPKDSNKLKNKKKQIEWRRYKIHQLFL
jgi:hypothetical protein